MEEEEEVVDGFEGVEGVEVVGRLGAIEADLVVYEGRMQCGAEVGVDILYWFGRTLGIWKIEGDVEDKVPSLRGKCQASRNGH